MHIYVYQFLLARVYTNCSKKKVRENVKGNPKKEEKTIPLLVRAVTSFAMPFNTL